MFADNIIWDVEPEPGEDSEDAMDRLGLPASNYRNGFNAAMKN